MMEILLDGCCVRTWKRSDEQSLVRNANNRRIWRNLRDRFPHPYRRSDARAWLAHVVGQQPVTNFAIAVGAEAVGGIGFNMLDDVHCRCAEIGYWLGEPFWGRGIATQALRAVTSHAFHSHPQVARLQASVFAWNPASARVLEKAGYSREGHLKGSVFKDGQIVDLFLYAILRDPCDPPPA